MRVLIGCEFSGIVRDAFLKEGHDAWSCDLLLSETKRQKNHIRGDILEVLDKGWDLMICHPPCTHLSVSGARWFHLKRKEQREAIRFAKQLLSCSIPRICLENPISILSTKIRRPDQIIQPWMFGHGETKAICLWLKNLPLLKPTRLVKGREPRVHHEPPGPDRWKRRSRFYTGIARAMGKQWGTQQQKGTT